MVTVTGRTVIIMAVIVMMMMIKMNLFVLMMRDRKSFTME